LDATLAPLQDALLASGLGQLFFAGYAWARPAIRLEEVATVASESKSFWNDGLVILTLAGEDSVEALLQLEAWVSLMAVTQNHTLVHFPAP
jgi:hypothetical protein